MSNKYRQDEDELRALIGDRKYALIDEKYVCGDCMVSFDTETEMLLHLILYALENIEETLESMRKWGLKQA